MPLHESAFPRYAIYFCPDEDSGLRQRGAAWLGRDIKTGDMLPHPQLPDISESMLHEHTASPRKYGLHATLKAPMFLNNSATEEDLLQAIEALAGSMKPIVIPELAVEQLGRFLALVPVQRFPALGELASRCVKELDDFREPLSEKELSRRKIHSMKPEARKNLMDWGYPYVLSAFRFHITLTDALPDAKTGSLFLRAAKTYFQDDLVTPLEISSICLCVQTGKYSPFTLMKRFNLGT